MQKTAVSVSKSDLPASAQAIADVIGVEATLKLAERYSDSRGIGKVYVPLPENLTESHPLACLLGLNVARTFAWTFGGDAVFVPRCRRAMRLAAIWRDFMAGLDVPQVAAIHHVTERHVRQVTAEERGLAQSDFRAMGRSRSPTKAAAVRLNGTLNGEPRTMINIFAKHTSDGDTPYGALSLVIKKFSPRYFVLLDENHVTEIELQRAVALVVPCLPAEIEVRHGDTASLMVVKPQAKNKEPLMIRVETPAGPKSLSQNALVINVIEAIAISSVIDKRTEKAA